VNVFTLYLLLLKATATTFAGLASLPVLRDELVVHRHLITDHQLNAAVVITRSTPGPVGVYVVSVGYFAGGALGAVAGWAAMATPALAVIVLLKAFASRAEHPRVKGMLESVVLASAALLALSTIPLARDALDGPAMTAIAIIGLLALLSRKVEAIWVIAAGAAISLLGAVAGISPLAP
jgi:chromate transporter